MLAIPWKANYPQHATSKGSLDPSYFSFSLFAEQFTKRNQQIKQSEAEFRTKIL